MRFAVVVRFGSDDDQRNEAMSSTRRWQTPISLRRADVNSAERIACRQVCQNSLDAAKRWTDRHPGGAGFLMAAAATSAVAASAARAQPRAQTVIMRSNLTGEIRNHAAAAPSSFGR
jgi:hypothetical protein